jgi:hypothetical protein
MDLLGLVPNAPNVVPCAIVARRPHTAESQSGAQRDLLAYLR